MERKIPCWFYGLLLTVLGLTGSNYDTAAQRFPSNAPHTSVQSVVLNQEDVNKAYGKLPLSFEANEGQATTQVKFLSRGRGYTLFLTPNEAVITLRQSSPHSESRIKTAESAVLRMKLIGANPQPQVLGLDKLPGKVNYFVGSDPSKWRTNISTYAKVGYHDIYPGIDLVYYGNQRQLEYDFVVAAGANPKAITLDFEGVNKLEVDVEGNLVLHTASGQVRQKKPLIYQEVDGIRREISGGYLLKGNHQVGFEVAAYDTTNTLIIDPTLSYSTYLGGSDDDQGNGIAVDSSGYAYVTGQTSSTNFPTTSGAYDTSANGSSDAFVTKLNTTGTALVYSTYLGGSSNDYGNGVAVEGGYAYVTGLTESSDFPTTSGAFQTTRSSSSDAFVTKLNSTGSALSYSTYLGGFGDERGSGIAVDSSGYAYITGWTDASDFPTTTGAYDTTANGNFDAFVTKMNTGGTGLSYSTYLGGSNIEHGYGIAVLDGYAYVTGRTFSLNFPTSDNAFQDKLGSDPIGGIPDAFVTKLNTTGSALSYSTYLGGGSSDVAFGIAVDADGNAYVTGQTMSSNFPVTTGAYQTSWGGLGDIFVTKMNSTGSDTTYSTYIGGETAEGGFSIAVDSSGNAYITGYGTSVDPGQGYPGAFVIKLNSSGSSIVYNEFLGGDDYSEGRGIAVDSSAYAYVTGVTWATDFPTTTGAYDTTANGGSDAFVAKR